MSSEGQLVALKRDPSRRWLLWWRPSGGGTYYPIHYDRVVCGGGCQLCDIRFIKNLLLSGETVYVKAEYDRAKKTLYILQVYG